jgi:hypothetical protein
MADQELGEQASEPMYLRLGSELERKLAENGVSLSDLAQKVSFPGIEVVTDPATPPDVRAEPITILLGTAAVIKAATPLLIRLIEVCGVREPAVVKKKRLVVALDGNSNMVVDANGNPIHGWEDHRELLESNKVSATKRSAKFVMPGCVELNIEDQRRS